MRKLSLILPFVLSALFLPSAFASSSLQGYCTQGGQKVFTNTIPSTTSVMQSYPQCTVTVFNTGTVVKATIFSNSTGTPLANPFVASSTGKWQFFAADGVYDVTLSGGGIPVPFTLSSLPLSSPGSTTIGPIVYETAFVGVDCGARVNAAYASLPATGGEIIVPEICSFATPIVFATANKAAILSSFGNATTMTYTGTTGTAITFNNGRPFDFTSSIRNVTLTGPGNATATIGVLIGGTNGAVGFSASLFKFQSFGTVLQTSSNTWITKFTQGMIRDGAVLFLEPSGQTQAGENVEFDHVTFADSPAPHTNAVWVQGGGQETVFNTCSFDQAQLRIGNGATSAAQVVVTNSHFENPNTATGGVDYTYIVVDHNNGNYLRFTDDFIEQDRLTGAAYTSFMNLAGGVVNISGLGIFTPVQLSSFAVLSNAVNINLFGYNDLSGQTVALYSGSTTGYIQSYPGANVANSSGFNTIQGAGDLFGAAATSLIQDVAVGTGVHNHILTVNGSENINTGSLNISGGQLQMGGQAAIDSSRNAFLHIGNFAGAGSTTAGEININDSGNAAAMTLNSTIAGLLTREATWLGTSNASLEVVNNVGTNDVVVFQNGGIRLPHTPSGTTGGTQACFDGSFNLSSGTCGGGGGGGGTPAGPTTAVQFNNSGSFGGSANLEWTGSSLTVTGTVVASSTGQFGGVGAPTTGLLVLNDSSNVATGIQVMENIAGTPTREANWNAGPAASFEVVNNVGTNDLIVFQNAGLRVPHIPTGTTGGTQACWDGSFNLSSGACGATGGGIQISVKSNGATGNGTTDDFAAINTTIGQVVSAGGGTVFFPAGTYSISQSLAWTADKIYLLGDGGATVAPRASFTGAGAIVVGQTSASSTPTQLGGISSLIVDLSANSGATLIGVDLIQTWSFIVNNVFIKNTNGLTTPIQTALQLHSGELPGATTAVIFAENNEIYNLRVTGSFVYGARHVTGCTGSCPNGQVNGTAYYGGSIFGDAPHPAGTFGLHIDDNSGDTTKVFGLRLEDFATCAYIGEQFNGPLDFRLEGCTVANFGGQTDVQYSTPYNPAVNTMLTTTTTATDSGVYVNRSGSTQAVTMPAITGAILGRQFYFDQYFSNTGVITLTFPAGVFLKINGVAGSSGGTFASGGSGTDYLCLTAENFAVYSVCGIQGSWTGTAGTGGGGSGVTSINSGLTGNVINVAITNTASTFTALQTFQGTGTVLAGIVQINDTGTTATGVELLESASRIANWNASPAASLQVVNSSGTNDLVVFQNGTVRMPHVPTSGTGTQACFTASFDLFSGSCGAGSGTVTSASWTGGIVSVANPTTTPAFTVSGASGGIPYFSSPFTWASSATLTANGVVIGGGAGNSPGSTAVGTGGQVLTSNGAGLPPTFQNAVSSGVSAINTSLTGNVTSVALTNTAQTFTALQQFSGTGSPTVGLLNLQDAGTTATGIGIFEAATRIANWAAGPSASFEVINSSATNDFIVFQNGTVRIPHILASGSGGTAVCVTSSGDLYKAPC